MGQVFIIFRMKKTGELLKQMRPRKSPVTFHRFQFIKQVSDSILVVLFPPAFI